MPFDAVLFDFGHTLYGHAPGPLVVEQAAGSLGIHLEPGAAERCWRDIDEAAMDPREVALGRDLDPRVWRARWVALYDRADALALGLGRAIDWNMHDPTRWVPYGDAAEALGQLADAGIAVGVASNTGWDVRGAFRAWGLDPLVRAYVLSYEVRMRKPDPALFLRACAELGAAPGRTLMVGDDPVADGGAAEAGLGVQLVVPGALGGPNGLLEAAARAIGMP